MLAAMMLHEELIRGTRAVGYGRVSTDKDDQLNSLTNQITSFADYFRDNKFQMVNEVGVLYKTNGSFEKLQGVYADEGITGTSLKKREAFKQMLQDAKAGKFDVIFTKSVQRWGRSIEDTAKAIKDLASWGVAVYFLDLKISTLDKNKEFIVNIFSSFAQEESRNKSDSVKFGVLKAMKQGKWCSSAVPYGYKKVDGYLEIVPDKAEQVKQIFHWYYYDGYGLTKIARSLNEMGIRATSSKNKEGILWSTVRISKMLENPIYIGKQVQHKVENDDVNRKTRKTIPEDEWIITWRKEIAIISEELFELVQTEKQRRGEVWGTIEVTEKISFDDEGNSVVDKVRKVKRGDTRHSNTHLFSNILVCGNCGNSLRRKKRHKKDGSYEWICRHNDKYGVKACKYRNNYSEDYLVKYLKQELLDYKEQRDSHDWNLEMYIESKFDTTDTEAKLTELAKKEERIKRMIDLNFEEYGDLVIPRDEYLERNERLQLDRRSIQEQKNQLLNVEGEIQRTRLKYDSFLQSLECLDVDNLSNGELRRLVDSIEVYSDERNDKRITIEWKFLDVTESDVIWDATTKEYERFEKDVWYAGMTEEDIQKEKEHEHLLQKVGQMA